MKLGILGGGNMAQAIVAGLLHQGTLGAADILVSEPLAQSRDAIMKLGVSARWDNAGVAESCDALLLAVKPQIMGAVLDEIRPASTPERPLVISIAAGKTTAWIEARLPDGMRVVRAMPNTPLMVGAGVSVLAGGRHATTDDLRIAHSIFTAAGTVMELAEKHFDAVTAVSGSGPAYFFRLVELLAAAGTDCGLPSDAAQELALRTCIGAARLLEETGVSPQELRRRVTSPGGTTAAAIDSLDRDQLDRIMHRAVAAAAARSAELGAAD